MPDRPPDEYDAMAKKCVPTLFNSEIVTLSATIIRSNIADGLRSAVASATGPLVAEVERLQAVLKVSNAEVLASVEGVVATIQPEFDRLREENERLRMSLAGRDKGLSLLNAGFESTCEDRDKLKQETRSLRADLAAAVGLLERIRKGCYLSGYAMALDVNDYLEAHKEAAK
jgi:hypothetical protein